MSVTSTPCTPTCYVGGMKERKLPTPEFGEWLDDQLRERRWSRPRLARLIDYSPAAVAAWVRGVRLPEERACIAIADAFGIDAGEVLERAGRPTTGLTTSPTEQSTQVPLTDSQRLTDDTVTQFLSRIESEVQQITAGMRRAGLLPGPPLELGEEVALPVIGRVPADSLRWTAVEEELSVDVTRAEVGNARAPFGLIASGDCFRWIGIWSGDVVICDRSLGREPKDRQIVVVRVNNDVTLKRWCVTGNGVELRDGDEQVVYRVQPEDDIEIIGFYLTYKPVAER